MQLAHQPPLQSGSEIKEVVLLQRNGVYTICGAVLEMETLTDPAAQVAGRDEMTTIQSQKHVQRKDIRRRSIERGSPAVGDRGRVATGPSWARRQLLMRT
jgi:hypothetical protein